MHKRILGTLLIALALAFSISACGSGGDDGNGNGSGNGNGQDPFGSGTGGGGLDPNQLDCAGNTYDAQAGPVDIIFAIDTSGSMDYEIKQVKDNINAFAGKIGQSGLDYHVIMIASRGTGTNQVCVPVPLGGADCADNLPTFHHVPQTVSSTNSLTRILSTYDQWKGDLRQEAFKVFVEITDDNQSGSLSETKFDDDLLALQPAGIFGTAQARNYTFHSIVGWMEGTQPLDPQKCTEAVNIGATYQKLSLLTGGIIDSVCKKDYSGVLDNLATGIVTKLACELPLPKAEGGQAVDPNKVVVRFTPPGGAPVVWTQLTDASKCSGAANEWHFDDPQNPTKIVLCKSACDGLGEGKVEILAGCKAPAPR